MPKFNPASDIGDLSDKVILVTGGNAGLGKATVEALAAHNSKCLYLCCRKRASGEALVQSIHEAHPKANVVVLELDLSDLDSVKECAKQFLDKADRLDQLILNAGVSSLPPQKTKQGFEYQFGVNHVGHALLTQLLMPTVLSTQKATGDARIVVVSSAAATSFVPSSGLVLEKMKTDGDGIGPLTAYGHSKLANVMFARKLAQLYPNITSTSLHPGTVKSEIWGKAEGAGWLLKYVLAPLAVALQGVTIEEGALTQLWAANAKKEDVKNGAFYWPVAKETAYGKNAGDQGKVDELWEWTDKELKAHGAPGWPQA